jgi:anaerobic selenocysteine-containing dehydrogenase
MERRDFFKILSATSAGVLGGCGSTSDKLIPLLVSDSEIVPGEEQWHPAVCTECAAGCGTIVRVMAGERVIEQKGEQVRQRIAAIKKIEGNPLNPISGGRLCARGQAAVQGLYHPDRLRGPMKRTGERGSGQFTSVSWDEAMSAVSAKLAGDPSHISFLTGPGAGSRSLAIERFLKAISAPPAAVCSVTDFSVERKATDLAFGWKGLPIYDIANARHILSVGADFLGGWASPVFYARQFGHFRQGRPGVRGNLVHAESRLSLTASAADRWLPVRPGTEPQFLAAVGHMLGVDAFAAVDAPALLAQCGVDQRRVREVVDELAASDAPLIVAGASIVQGNSLDAVFASHVINSKFGNIGKKGGVLPPAAAGAESRPMAEALANSRVVFLDGANPAYSLPPSAGALDALKHAEFVVSFSGFLDDSAAFADYILPGHHALESELAVIPTVSAQTAVAIATPFVLPLYDTRPVEKILADLSKQPAVTARDIVQPLLPEGTAYTEAARQGGVSVEVKASPAPHSIAQPATLDTAVFSGDAGQFPLQFQAYPSLQFGEGKGANLPWLQELPDPASSGIWGLPVEIDPRTASSLKISTGDMVRVESPHGTLEAAAYVHPGAIPGVLSMAIGDGHTHYTRYASSRGANPISILSPAREKSGAQILGGVRVRLARVSGPRNFTQFSAPDREESEHNHR